MNKTQHVKPDGSIALSQPVEADGTPHVFLSGGSTATPKTMTNAAALVTSIVKAGARTLISGSGRIDSTATTGTYFLQFIDAAALPANGAVTMLAPPQKFVHASGADDPWNFECPQGGLAAANGIVVALSTTEFTLTIAGAFLSGGIETS